MNPDSNDAQSQNNVANPEVQPIGFFEALLVLARGDYMLLSEKQKTEDMQDNLTNNYVNVGVMSALLLGMVDVTSDGVGDKIVEAGGMSQDACDYVMVCLNTLAFLLFFLATLQSLIKRVHELRGDRTVGSGHGQPPQLTLQALFRGLGFLLGGTDLDLVLDYVSRCRHCDAGRMRSHLPGCHLRSDQECASSLPSEAQCWAGQQGATRGNQGNTG
jgi:hypothetical protein